MSIVALAATYNLHQVLPLRAILGELLQPVAVISVIYLNKGINYVHCFISSYIQPSPVPATVDGLGQAAAAYII